MKKFISIIVTIMIILQSIVLYLFFNDKLSNYPINLVDILWVGSALLGISFGVLFFRINKEIKKPESTIIMVVLLGIIGFPFMIFNYWAVEFLLIILTFGVHFYMYRDSKFTILPVISSIMGIYSIVLYLLMNGITSM
ncbi:hypothetical protein HBE96_18010 [Clostridium sp. P21]|uniref:Uncharacterized protein n=1 Tax=Clostridium muellerianum TaxID=2716538 RepID=A0A7Y0ELB1_9CLOT|nr:hypothetical protein [Clostridium muellerianum]NMM64510.1 hypothetical protein [Clostridium muellerianum]